MAGNAIMEMLFLFLIVFYNSDASFGWELRKLVGEDPKDDSTVMLMHDSPLLTPAPGDNKSDLFSSNETLQVVPKGSNNSTISPAPPPLAQTNNENVDPKGSNNLTPSSPPSIAKSDDDKNHEIEKKNEGITISLSDTDESCNDMSAKCKDEGDIVACISESGPNYLVILVQNEGDSTLKVKFFMEKNLGDIEVPKHKTEKVNISLISSGSALLTFNAGRGNCVLHTGTLVPQEKMFPQLASYDKLLTPENGAYFLILIVIVAFGGTWACWSLRNKKHHDGVAYQQLEMELPESVSATGIGNSEGWDQDWDDDWDEEAAVKSPGKPHAGSISADGLTSRSSNRDGWENSWDD